MTAPALESLRILSYAARQLKTEGLPLSLVRAVETLITEIDEALPVGTLAEKPIRLRLGGPTEAEIATARRIVEAAGKCDGIPCVDCPDFCTGVADQDDIDAEPEVLRRAREWLVEIAR